MTRRFSEYPKSTKTWIVIGGAFIVFGFCILFNQYMHMDWWNTTARIAGAVSSYFLPAALIALGLYLLWAAKHDRLSGVFNGPREGALTRSRVDRRFTGVCGGIAHYFKMDSVVVRIVALLLFVASPLPALIAYAALSVILPRS
jgi:phage shock protein PspC (stress-responsive transcriptional regulator)